MSDGIRIEPASRADLPLILELIRGLAEYEKEPQAATATLAQIERALFGDRPAAECVIARLDGVAAGFALWFQSFSTWTGQPGMWLEDLFVKPEQRRRGVGEALLRYLAGVCLGRGYGRFEWSVLDWNAPALDFYKRLGAQTMDEWTIHRVSGDALRHLAQPPAME